jgi:DNA-binding PadR family transcriptional regulator
MRRDLHFFWPRAESNLYAEPKKLVARGLAQADSQPRGLRRRTVYSITPSGLRALTAWLGTPTAAPRWESESIVKLVFATYGSRDQLLEHLHGFREQANARRQEVVAVFEPYLHGDEPFPDRTHLNVLAARLVLSIASTEAAWADKAIQEVEQWPTTAAPDDRARTLTMLEEALRARSP